MSTIGWKPKRFLPLGLMLLSLMALLGLGAIFTIHTLEGPVVTVVLEPSAAYADTILRGSATHSSSDGSLEGIDTYRWLINEIPIAAGDVPQSMLLPMDGSPLSTDGEAPTHSQGLAFVAGQFREAVRSSRAFDSRLVYRAGGNVDTNEGSIEMWINLTHSLAAPSYDGHPRLFSYIIDGENQLYIEVADDRIVLNSRNAGNHYSTWPSPPGWQAREWHHLAATWSSSGNRMAVYYDCVLVAESDYPGLAGTANSFNLGSADDWGVMDAVFDDVRLSRRAHSAEEIAATCSRGAAAPSNEVILLPGQAVAGDKVTFELTPCDETGACSAPLMASVTIADPHLGALSPSPGLLPAGAVSVTLSLTTALPANCRWNQWADTPYEDMSHNFEQGQGTTDHSTNATCLGESNECHYYVRCADLGSPPARDPDHFERATHFRVLGPWPGDYPRLANLWGVYDHGAGPGFFAGYDLFVPAGWDGHGVQAAAVRAANPNAKILLGQNATYGWPGLDPLTTEWWNSHPGDVGYNCLLRDSSGEILLVDYWGHPMYNMTQPYCLTVLVEQSVDTFRSQRPDQGYNLAYDGIFWDRLHDSISWLLGHDIDSDMDGQPDDLHVLDAAYKAGVTVFLTRVQTHLPNAILVGNEAPQDFAPILNGRLFEWQLPRILDGADWLHWDAVVNEYRNATDRGRTPRITIIQSAPEALYSQKYTFQHLEYMLPAMETEAAASYQRMRYGLTSALMGDGLFSYDYGGDRHGNLWWYDEFGAAGGSQADQVTTLPPRGYLGQPTGAPALLVDTLDTPNQVVNGGFDEGLNGWNWWVDSRNGAAATIGLDTNGGIPETATAHIAVTSVAEPWTVALMQFDLDTVDDQSYTLSFWARSDVTRTIEASIIKQTTPWTNYGFNVQALVTPEWQHFHLPDDAAMTAEDGQLQFLVGDVVGDLWLDDVQFQAGALGVWARPFSGGLAVINTTKERQTVPLPGVYCKLNGSQAPLFQVRVDDSEAKASTGWSERAAGYSQFGPTVQVALADTPAAVTYTPTLAYSGTYRVRAWVAPATNQSSAVSVTIHHAEGEAEVLLDQASGSVGWQSLGTYPFKAGKGGSAVLAATGDGVVVADALSWVSTARYNDGSQVNRITLLPQDGIVLLSKCD